MRSLLGPTVLAMLAISPASAFAQTGKYNVTPEEHAACDNDAYRLCSDANDEDRLLVCMKANRQALTPHCRVVFNEGLKKRHLNR